LDEMEIQQHEFLIFLFFQITYGS